jgi:hypothetical protein
MSGADVDRRSAAIGSGIRPITQRARLDRPQARPPGRRRLLAYPCQMLRESDFLDRRARSSRTDVCGEPVRH